MNPVSFYKCLADDTRLRCLLLIAKEEELCVCELMESLGEIQPKVSRHLAKLKQCGLVVDRRQGKWVHYSMSPTLPAWCMTVLKQTLTANLKFIQTNLKLLALMGDRPDHAKECC